MPLASLTTTSYSPARGFGCRGDDFRFGQHFHRAGGERRCSTVAPGQEAAAVDRHVRARRRWARDSGVMLLTVGSGGTPRAPMPTPSRLLSPSWGSPISALVPSRGQRDARAEPACSRSRSGDSSSSRSLSSAEPEAREHPCLRREWPAARGAPISASCRRRRARRCSRILQEPISVRIGGGRSAFRRCPRRRLRG